MMDLILYCAGIVLVLGAVFCLLAAVGMLRLPDVYTRMHAASKAGAVGGGLMFAAIGLVGFDGPILLRAIVGFIFIVLTTPISAHILARAAYESGIKPLGVNEREATHPDMSE